MLQKQYHLLRQTAFRRFLLSCILAMFGNGLTYIIMVWSLMHFNASIVSTATLMTCFWLPNVLFGPFFGVLADRWNRKKILLVANGSRGLCLLIFALLARNNMTALSIYVLATIIGTLLSAYIPVAMTFVRDLVKQDDLLHSNALVDVGYEVGAVLGMGSAGFILATTSIDTCFFINALCYILATVLVYRITYHYKRESNQAIRDSFWQDMYKGAQYISSSISLVLIYLTQGIFFVCYMTAPVLLAPYAKTVLHSNVTQFGWLEAMLSLGIILGGLFSPWLASRYSMLKVAIGQILLGIVGFYLFSHTLNNQHAIIYQFAIGLSFSSWALITTLAQEMTNIDFQGRAQSLFNSLSGIVIILFYYCLAQWEETPIAKLYLGEVVLLFIALSLLTILLIRNKQDDVEDLDAISSP